jgi:hypothetical protein
LEKLTHHPCFGKVAQRACAKLELYPERNLFAGPLCRKEFANIFFDFADVLLRRFVQGKENEVEYPDLLLLRSAAGCEYRAHPSEQPIKIPALSSFAQFGSRARCTDAGPEGI